MNVYTRDHTDARSPATRTRRRAPGRLQRLHAQACTETSDTRPAQTFAEPFRARLSSRKHARRERGPRTKGRRARAGRNDGNGPRRRVRRLERELLHDGRERQRRRRLRLLQRRSEARVDSQSIRLDGRGAAVTGGGAGIGRGIALASRASAPASRSSSATPRLPSRRPRVSARAAARRSRSRPTSATAIRSSAPSPRSTSVSAASKQRLPGDHAGSHDQLRGGMTLHTGVSPANR